MNRAPTLFVLIVAVACQGTTAAPQANVSQPVRETPMQIAAPSPEVAATPPPSPPLATLPENGKPLLVASPPQCSPGDWSPRKLPPLLRPKPTKSPSSSRPDQQPVSELAFDPECSDSPNGPQRTSPNPLTFDGVEIRLVSATPAGTSRRGWAGNQCSFDVRLADGSGPPVRLGSREIPPFTTVSAVARSGSAVFLAVSFNGYTREFPAGGNRIIALDLCDGRVVWKSKDSMSNGGLLLLGDYLVSPYGFTSERRYVFVLDAHSGTVVQKLPVIENICPSKSWAPHWHPGEQCDAPGQAVGAANAPRIEGGVFLVDTNTGSCAFQLE